MKNLKTSSKRSLTTRVMEVRKIYFVIDEKSEGNKLRIKYFISDGPMLSLEFTELLATKLMQLYNMPELATLRFFMAERIMFVFEGEYTYMSYPIAIYVSREIEYNHYSRVWYDIAKKNIVSFDEL